MTDSILPLQRDDHGEPVRDLQDRLVAFCAAVEGSPGIDGDSPGVFGPGTEAAVRWFQGQRGLAIDGVVGRQTWAELVEAGQVLGGRLLYLTKPMMRGDDVAELQRRLGGLGFDARRVDGIFGPDTAAATEDFQRNAGLVADGIAGPDTVAAIARLGRRSADNQPVTQVREAEEYRALGRLSELRVVVGDLGGASVLADALGRAVAAAGADPVVLHDPDASRVAATANRWGADLVLGPAVGARSEIAYYGRADYVSQPGRRLGLLIEEAFHGLASVAPASVRAMTTPLLRETRMPAVTLTIGPPEQVVPHAAVIVRAVVGAIDAWAGA